MLFAEAVNLPFNAEIIRTRFSHRKPGQLEASETGYWVFLQGESMLLTDGALYRGALPAPLASERAALVFGEWDGEPVRVATVPREQTLPASFSAVPWGDLPHDLMTLYGLARQIVYWEKMSSRCSRCGSEMERIQSTWGKKCVSCGHEHYPHIHPCVIVLIRRGEEFLLVRKPEWPQGRFSLVAGFVDFGESLEECVVREVFEETGVTVTNIRYVGSQNWPFPSQLMAGFVADYVSGDIFIEAEELAEGGWFSKEKMPPALPPKRSIARWIIDRFALGLEPDSSPEPR